MHLFVGVFSVCHLQLISTMLSVAWRDDIFCGTFITVINWHVQEKAAVESGHAVNVMLCGVPNLLRSLRTLLTICFRLFTALYLW